jgi:Family of unknown function (DUF6489)
LIKPLKRRSHDHQHQCRLHAEEARAFLGLPDLKPTQDKITQQMQEQMSEGLRAMSPEDTLKKLDACHEKLRADARRLCVFQQMTGAKRDK